MVHTEWSPLCVVDWQQESPKSSADVLLLWVRNLQQEWDLLFFLLQSPWLSAVCLSSHIIPQSAQNYWPWCAVSWDCGCSFLLSTSCSGDILVIAEIAEQNENIIDFIKFRVLTDSSRLPAATCYPGDGRLTGSVIFTHVWYCHKALLNLSGMNAGFPTFREQSNVGRFYLGVYWLACLCVNISSIELRKLFLLSVTSPTPLLMIPSPQKKNDKDAGWDVLIDLSDILNK